MLAIAFRGQRAHYGRELNLWDSLKALLKPPKLMLIELQAPAMSSPTYRPTGQLKTTPLTALLLSGLKPTRPIGWGEGSEQGGGDGRSRDEDQV